MIYYAKESFWKHLKNRQIPYQSVKGPLHEVSNNLLLYGNLNLSNDSNTWIFESVHNYISKTSVLVLTNLNNMLAVLLM